MRAGLAGQLAAELGLAPLDAAVALLTGPELVRSPFVTAYRVELAEHYHPRRLNEYLRQHGIGRVTPVQIGSRIDPREVMKKLKLAGPEHRFVILTRAAGAPAMIVGHRL